MTAWMISERFFLVHQTFIFVIGLSNISKTSLMNGFIHRLLSELFIESKPLVDTVISNREHWLTLEHGNIVSPMEILTNDID